MIKNLKVLYKDIVKVSKLSRVGKKKIRIMLSIALANITVLADLLIIVVFSRILGKNLTSTNFVVDFLLNNIYILPAIIIFRFIAIYVEKTNIQLLVLQIMQNLKDYIIREVYKKGNFSVSDATFYSGIFSTHISTFYGSLGTFLNNVIQLIIYSTFLIFLDLRTVSYFIIGGIVLIFPTKYLLKLGRKYIHKSYIAAQDISRNLQRVIDNIFLIKILKTSEYEFKQYNKHLDDFTKAQYNNIKFGTINSLVPNFTALIILSLLVAFTDVSEVLTLEFLGVTLRLVQVLGNVNLSLNQVVNTQVHIERFKDFEKEIPKVKDYYKVDENQDASVLIENLSFKYFNSDNYIFKNLDLSIKKNEHTVITGPNGSGKSTLLGLIAGIFYPEQGSVNLSSKNIGYVGVTPLIITGTLKENILYGNNRDVEEREMLDLLNEFKLFNEESEIDLNMEVSNNTLSSGQMQKISFIRSLLANSEILLLDESTSNLDIRTKQFIFEILNSKSITIINSTHNHEDFEYDNHLKIEIMDDIRTLKSIN